MAKNPRYDGRQDDRSFASSIKRLDVADVLDPENGFSDSLNDLGGRQPTRSSKAFHQAAAKKGVSATGTVKTPEQLQAEAEARAARFVAEHKKQHGDPATRIHVMG